MVSNNVYLSQFIGKLYGIVNDPRYQNYIRWGPTGSSFLIVNPVEFTHLVLSDNFKHTNISSFIRQLNKYDFHKVKSTESAKKRRGSGIWEFVHKNFKKDRLDLIKQIVRKKSTGDKSSVSRNERTKDSQEYDHMFHSYVVHTMSGISRYFELVAEDMQIVRKFLIEQARTNLEPRFKVLIAEDNFACARYAAGIVRQHNAAFVCSMSLNDFHYQYRNFAFDMVLLSAAITTIDDIIRSIRSVNPRKIIVLMADKHITRDDIERRFPSINHVIYKPYTHTALKTLLDTYHQEVPADKKPVAKKSAYSNVTP
ncbi:hypothetical protein ENBRE01_0150 [Enteropsectra breve]|nr:hypothetical protein ENBRE01_0150 [Enteropsectra breve]